MAANVTVIQLEKRRLFFEQVAKISNMGFEMQVLVRTT